MVANAILPHQPLAPISHDPAHFPMILIKRMIGEPLLAFGLPKEIAVILAQTISSFAILRHAFLRYFVNTQRPCGPGTGQDHGIDGMVPVILFLWKIS